MWSYMRKFLKSSWKMKEEGFVLVLFEEKIWIMPQSSLELARQALSRGPKDMFIIENFRARKVHLPLFEFERVPFMERVH